MSVMLGFNNADNEDEAAIQHFIEKTKKRFTLALITEYFDESLVILKRKLCWDISDIIYLTLRARSYDRHNNDDTELFARHKAFSNADYMLYDFFLEEFKEEMGKQKEFEAELNVYRQVLRAVSDFCGKVVAALKVNTTLIHDIAARAPGAYFDPSPWGKPFEITAFDCAVMSMRTRIHRNIVLLRQFPELCSGQFAKDDTSLLVDPIQWVDENTLAMNPSFCENLDKKTGFPMNIMARQDVYMWKL